MTTPYAVSTNIGSSSFNNYVNTPILGPLSTNQYPSTIPYHSYGTLSGIRPTPPQFFPSQEPIYSEQGVIARQQYLRATGFSTKTLAEQKKSAKFSHPVPKFIYSSGKQYPVSSHVNYIAPIPSSMYVNIAKSVAVGKSAYKVGLPNYAPITTKNYYPSGTRTALQRARSSGCTAPKKKGSIYNTSLRSGGINAWGAIPRQAY